MMIIGLQPCVFGWDENLELGYCRILEADDRSNYVGSTIFEHSDMQECKIQATCFLARLLCNGIRIDYIHYELLGQFYDSISRLIEFITANNSGSLSKSIHGNYEGTQITITLIDDKSASYFMNGIATKTYEIRYSIDTGYGKMCKVCLVAADSEGEALQIFYREIGSKLKGESVLLDGYTVIKECRNKNGVIFNG